MIPPNSPHQLLGGLAVFRPLILGYKSPDWHGQETKLALAGHPGANKWLCNVVYLNRGDLEPVYLFYRHITTSKVQHNVQQIHHTINSQPHNNTTKQFNKSFHKLVHL